MPYDESLAGRVRGILARRHDVTEKRMFGGIAFMVRGHMSIGIVGDDLMVRVGPEKYAALLKKPHARPMDFTGKPLTGFLYVGLPALVSYVALERWMNHGIAYADSLPVKGEPRPREARASKGTAAKKSAPRKTATTAAVPKKVSGRRSKSPAAGKGGR